MGIGRTSITLAVAAAMTTVGLVVAGCASGNSGDVAAPVGHTAGITHSHHARHHGKDPAPGSGSNTSVSTTTFAVGSVQACAVFPASLQSQILGLPITGAKATLGLGDYDCNYWNGQAGPGQMMANIDLQCNKTNAASGWALYTTEGQGQPLPGDKFHVRQIKGSHGRSLGAMLPDHCFLQGDIGSSSGGQANLKGAAPLQSAMDQAVQANVRVG